MWRNGEIIAPFIFIVDNVTAYDIIAT
jgi:hypothetical protein